MDYDEKPPELELENLPNLSFGEQEVSYEKVTKLAHRHSALHYK